MSAEKWKKMEDWEISNAERISELKANFDDHTHLVWFNKIKELENHWTRQQEELDYLMKEFKRLEKVAMIVENKFNEEIAELKEAFEKREEHQFNDYFKLQRFEEVLRELGEEIKTFRDDEGYGTYSIEKILAKLSGSGGEKLLVKKSLLGAVGSTPNSSLANSKPPELVEDFEYRLDLSEELKELEGEPREDEYLCKICTADIRSVIYKGNLYWMPKAEGYIPVKREDLQFLFNYIHSASSTPEEEKDD